MPTDELDGSVADGHADNPDVYIRPFGYVADEPVVRHIGDRDIFVGNGRAAHADAHEYSFQYVLSATREARPLTTHHHPLADGPGTAYSEFAAAVDTARRLHRRDGRLLVHCKAGVSRSSAIVATALAAEEDHRLRDAFGAVQDARPHAMPHPALHELAVTYLAATG